MQNQYKIKHIQVACNVITIGISIFIFNGVDRDVIANNRYVGIVAQLLKKILEEFATQRGFACTASVASLQEGFHSPRDDRASP